jgi:hypothetical protein
MECITAILRKVALIQELISLEAIIGFDKNFNNLLLD